MMSCGVTDITDFGDCSHKTTNITKKRILCHEQKTIQKTNCCKTKNVTKAIRRYMLQPFFGQDMA